MIGKSAANDNEVQDALDELRQLTENHPALVRPAAFLSQVLPILYTKSREQIPKFTRETALAKLHRAAPLLRGEKIRIDERGFRRRWSGICTALQRCQDATATSSLAK